MRGARLLTLSFLLLLLSACAPSLPEPPIGSSGYPEFGGAASASTAVAMPSTTIPGTPATGRPTATARATPSTTGTMQTVWETFYAAFDNDPSGSLTIAYPTPEGKHARAGGVGTYANPITLAADVRWLPAGTRVYAPRWRKYFIMEDQCVECEADWADTRFHHVDLFMSPSMKAGALGCEVAATKERAENDIIVLRPPRNLPVDPTPLYTDAGGCVQAAHQY
jgi:hypothetical protein